MVSILVVAFVVATIKPKQTGGSEALLVLSPLWNQTNRGCIAGRRQKTMKAVTLILTFWIIAVFSQATPIAADQPQPNLSFKPNQTQLQNAGSSSCTYTVTIRTSCSSPSYTRDRISLSFGDAYGYQVYVPRLDDPYSGTFERCSTDTFEIYGPCTYQICYLYLYRTGYDGWIPESVTVYTYNYQPVTFYYNTFIPNGIWYGFDYCRGYLPSTTTAAAL